jgi:hypothetical protein
VRNGLWISIFVSFGSLGSRGELGGVQHFPGGGATGADFHEQGQLRLTGPRIGRKGLGVLRNAPNFCLNASPNIDPARFTPGF